MVGHSHTDVRINLNIDTKPTNMFKKTITTTVADIILEMKARNVREMGRTLPINQLRKIASGYNVKGRSRAKIIDGIVSVILADA